ncbi:unnamed protein product [Effrenium voratum]|nr:unnamed protein product [Effrenium voratum]
MASLFPDMVPEDFQPSSVKLLRKLHQQLAQAPGADSLEEPTIPESLPAASAPREAELPECKAAPRGHKGGKKRSKDQDAEEAEDRPKKVTRSLSAFFPRAQEPGDDQGDQGKGL